MTKLRIPPILLICLFAIITFWQISSFQFSLKWDTADQYFPWRYYLSECLRNGHWPLWMPYEINGYPFHGDPQSAAWYPIAWIIALFSYSLYAVHIEFVLTLFIAGWGMYKLSQSLHHSEKTSLIVSFAYLSCGFFVGNAQHLTWVISAAWIPWIFWAWVNLHHRKRTGYALLLALFAFLLFTGGYPAFLAVTFYALFFDFLRRLLRATVTTSKKEVLILFRLNFVWAALFVLLSAAMIMSILHVQPYINRGEGTSLQSAHYNPFTPQSLISLVLPFATIRNNEFFAADISMINAYFGIISLLFLSTYLLAKKTKTEIIFLVAGLFCLLTSFGPYTPVRRWLYEYVPLMNLFRFPAMFRLFFIIPFLLVVGFALERFFKDTLFSKRVKKMALLFIAALAAMTLIAIIKNYSGTKPWAILTDPAFFFDHSTVYDHIIIQATLQLVILSVFLFLLHKSTLIKWLPLLVGAELFLAAQLNIPTTAVANFTVGEIQKKVNSQPKGFPLPNGLPIIRHTDAHNEDLQPLWRNLNIFRKQVAIDGYNPFALRNFDKFTGSAFKDSVWNNRLLYLSDCPALIDRTDTLNFNHKTIFVEKRVYEQLKMLPFISSMDDKIKVSYFSPDKIEAHITTKYPQILTLLQNNFDGWKVKMDGKPVEHFTGNYTFISLPVEKGEHQVVFEYAPVKIYFALGISATSLLGLLILLLLLRKTIS